MAPIPQGLPSHDEIHRLLARYADDVAHGVWAAADSYNQLAHWHRAFDCTEPRWGADRRS
jgi:hypothetical protein